MKKRLVVDVSILRSCENPDYYICSELLEFIFHICHKVYVSESIIKEYFAVTSPTVALWVSKMMDKDKLIDFDEKCRNSNLRSRVDNWNTIAERKKELLDDIRYVECALQLDRIVISRDSRFEDDFLECVHETSEFDVRFINLDHVDSKTLRRMLLDWDKENPTNSEE